LHSHGLTPLTYNPVGHIDIEICERCKGPVKTIACIEDSAVIEKILKHLKEKAVFKQQQRPAATREGTATERVV